MVSQRFWQIHFDNLSFFLQYLRCIVGDSFISSTDDLSVYPWKTNSDQEWTIQTWGFVLVTLPAFQIQRSLACWKIPYSFVGWFSRTPLKGDFPASLFDHWRHKGFIMIANAQNMVQISCRFINGSDPFRNRHHWETNKKPGAAPSGRAAAGSREADGPCPRQGPAGAVAGCIHW